MNDWQSMTDPIPDPGNQWDNSTWVLYTVEGVNSPWMAVTTLVGFYNMVHHAELNDPVPKHWMLIEAPGPQQQEPK